MMHIHSDIKETYLPCTSVIYRYVSIDRQRDSNEKKKIHYSERSKDSAGGIFGCGSLTAVYYGDCGTCLCYAITDIELS